MDNQELAKVLGQHDAEIVAGFLAVISSLRKQPGFDDAKFKADIQTKLDKKYPSETINIILAGSIV